MAKTKAEAVWRRIKVRENEQFHTKTGKPFTYEIMGNVLRPSRTVYNISISEVRKALELVPFDGPGVISQFVRGPSYLWAILHDPRIRGTDW